MKILVTGGAGFIGSHLVEACLEAGHDLTVVDDLSRGKKEHVPRGARLYVMDIQDGAIKQVFEKTRPEVIFHQAAQVNVRESVADPLFDAKINILGSVNLLQLAVEFGTKKFIFASTGGAIYGDQEYFPADENHPTRPLSPYGIAKLTVERYLYFYQKVHGIESVSLRYSNVYGPRQDPYGEAGVVAIFMERMLSKKPVLINGPGEQTRDFVYVRDVVKANMKALDLNVSGEINIATGIEASVNHIFKIIKDITGSNAKENHGPAKSGETFRSVLDIKKAKRELDWKPEFNLDEGLKLTAEFYGSQAKT
jgi:UDP-glucose 4-epimerase